VLEHDQITATKMALVVSMLMEEESITIINIIRASTIVVQHSSIRVLEHFIAKCITY